MSGNTSPHSYPNDPWFKKDTIASLNLHQQSLTQEQHILFPIDESEEFHDPFSDLNLYLSKKIKQIMQKHGTVNKWSSSIQTTLLEKILPEFRVKFPKYRLGLSALKKIWEKVMYYYEKVQTEKAAVTEKGTINLAYMLKENLKNYPQRAASNTIHPYNYAYQLALKMSDCIATLDGIRPDIDRLTKLIWSVQKHLLPKEAVIERSPFECVDKLDRCLVKILLEIASKHPNLPHEQLVQKMTATLKAYQTFHIEDLNDAVSAVLAKKINEGQPSLQDSFIRFIKQQLNLCVSPKSVPKSIYKAEVVARIYSLIELSTQIPKFIDKNALKAITEYIYSLFLGEKIEKCPVNHPLFFKFVHIQLSLLHEGLMKYNATQLAEMIFVCYEQFRQLPLVTPAVLGSLEAAIWTIVAEKDIELQSITETQRHLIEEEIANALIEYPTCSFQKCVQEVVQRLLKIQQLNLQQFDISNPIDTHHFYTQNEIEYKILLWALQNDVLYRWIQIDHHTSILTLIEKQWKEKGCMESSICHLTFVISIWEAYVFQFPSLMPFKQDIIPRIWMMYKFFWYNKLSSNNESSYDRFIKWHFADIKFHKKRLSIDEIYKKIEEISEQMLPLVPFNASHIKHRR